LRFAGDKVGLITPTDLYAQNKNTIDLPAEKLIKIFPRRVNTKKPVAASQLNVMLALHLKMPL
jgi:hypothetical protein